MHARRQADLAAASALAEAANALQDRTQRQQLTTLLDRFKEYRTVIEEQESLLQTIVLDRERHPESVDLVQDSRRWSLEADQSQETQQLQLLRQAVAREQEGARSALLQLRAAERDLQVCVI